MPTPLQQLANSALSYFTTDKRDDGTEFVRTKDGTPEWVRDMCHEAHGHMLPDDYRYQFTQEALESLADAADPDDITPEADVNTWGLLSWLASRVDRYEYCEEFRTNCGEEQTFWEMMHGGQYTEKAEVLSLVRWALENELSRRETPRLTSMTYAVRLNAGEREAWVSFAPDTDVAHCEGCCSYGCGHVGALRQHLAK